MGKIIGRKAEINALEQAFGSGRPELVAVLGRRRVGKTYLVRSFFGEKLDFEMVGLKDGTKEQQLRNFAYSLKEAKGTAQLGPVPTDWLDAFHQLKEYLSELGDLGRKKVVFIDELPWVATRKSDFLTGFGYFWNSFASKSDIVVIICGSATAWMIQKILNNRGGLHNRVTRRLLLAPFTLAETEAYFQAKSIHFDRYQILLLYMAMGGVPHYLDQVQPGKSAIQNIDEVCFQPQGALRTEFDNLYSSLFAFPERYVNIVNALSGTWRGLSRNELLAELGTSDGGWLSSILQELEMSGFISSYISFGKKKKDTLYRLTDHYSLFYLKFIQGLPSHEAGRWDTLSQTQTWKSWSGYAFENICLQHVDKIKRALGISGIHTRQYSYLARDDERQSSTQIDLLIDRNDNAITICELKFYKDAFVLHKPSAEQLRRRLSIFRNAARTKKQVFLTLVTVFGLAPNQHSIGLVDSVVTMDDLFEG